jgi:hypothetical protein
MPQHMDVPEGMETWRFLAKVADAARDSGLTMEQAFRFSTAFGLLMALPNDAKQPERQQ